MRRALFTLLLVLAAAPTAAVAQLPAPPPPPPLPTVPTLPLPLPAPLPTVPSVPSVPAPAPPATPQPPAVSTPAGSPSGPSAGGGHGSSGASPSPTPARSSGTTPKRKPSVVLAFEAPASGRLAIPLRQVAPVCRAAGRLLFRARAGANRFRFNGRVSGRPLRDGTYVATTPSGTIRFAIVDGKPTRSAARLAASVCDFAVLGAGAGSAVGAVPPKDPAKRTEPAPATNIDRGATDEPGPLPQVLGTAFTEAAEAAASLHPAFYILLALAMVALAFATVPARVVPVASAGAVLARRRAAVTLAGTVCLLFVIVVYWATLL